MVVWVAPHAIMGNVVDVYLLVSDASHSWRVLEPLNDGVVPSCNGRILTRGLIVCMLSLSPSLSLNKSDGIGRASSPRA